MSSFHCTAHRATAQCPWNYHVHLTFLPLKSAHDKPFRMSSRALGSRISSDHAGLGSFSGMIWLAPELYRRSFFERLRGHDPAVSTQVSWVFLCCGTSSIARLFPDKNIPTAPVGNKNGCPERSACQISNPSWRRHPVASNPMIKCQGTARPR